MDNEVCLLIIYNHRYDRNIKTLNQIYQSRFSNIYHIIPFYDGTEQNVITVYECSFRFEGYVAQAMKQIKEKYTHYLFIGDDAIINPAINETNYREWFGITEKSAFITFTKTIRQMKGWGINRRFMDPFPKFEEYQGTLWENEIMSAEEAFAIAEKQGYSKEEFVMDLSMIWNARKKWKAYPRLIVMFGKILIGGKKYCPYPIWGGYSDVFVIPGKDMERVAHMLGVFAAMGIFVEEAIPTALHLNCEELVEEKDIQAVSHTLWSNDERNEIEKKYDRDLYRLMNEWDRNFLFIHPIKLSRWKFMQGER